MALTNYPNGVSSFGVPVMGFGQYLPAGKVFWVNGTTGQNSTGRGDSPTNPFRSINFASTQCVANRGDVILVQPGHQEYIATAGGVTLGVAGVTVIGLGYGDKRPLLISTDVAASVVISAGQVSIVNCLFMAQVDAATTHLSINGQEAQVRNCFFMQALGANQSLNGITLAAAGGKSVIEGNTFYAIGAGGAAAITCASGLDFVQILDNDMFGNFSSAPIFNDTAAMTNCIIKGNRIRCLTATIAGIVLHASTTGLICDNYLALTTIAAGGSITAAAAHKIQNFTTEAAASSGILDPASAAL